MPEFAVCFIVICAATLVARVNDKPAALTFATLGFLGGRVGAFALGINPEGHAVSDYMASAVQQNFPLRQGEFTTIDPPGGTGSTFWGPLSGTTDACVSPQDYVVGFYVADGVTQGLIAR